MQEAVPVGAGAMAAIIGLGAETVEQACEEAAQGDVVSPANINGGGQVVIAGSCGGRAARLGACEGARGAGVPIRSSVSAPFHCALMKPARNGWRRNCARWR